MKTATISLCALFVASAWAQHEQLDVTHALQLASQNRPSLQAARLKVLQARQSARALGAYPATTIGLGYSSVADIGAVDQDAFLAFPLDVFGRTQAGRASGTALVQQAEATYLGELLGLQTEVLGALGEAVAAIRLSATADAVLANAQQLKTAVDRKVEEGKVPQVQQTRAGIELMRARQASELRRTQKGAALKRLAARLGIAVPEESLAQFPVLAGIEHVDIGNRPDLLLIKADITAARADANATRASLRPSLELQALRSPWHDEGSRIGPRLQLSWAVLDFGRGRNEINASETRAKTGEQALKDARLQADAEFATAKQELASAQAQVESYKALLGSARELLRKTQLGYEEGLTTLIEVLEAARAVREVEEGSVEADHRLSEALIDLYRAAGIVVGGLK